VLAVEGASFIENDPGRVQMAYDLGVRHLQLVHYVSSALGDYQTVAPLHGGLTDVGRKVIQECNRLGILVDLAHATPRLVDHALAVSKVPVVWSHSLVTRGPEPNWRMIGWKARQLPYETAKAIAAKGGVIGLWAFAPDVGKTPDSYARRLAELADWLGEDHAAIGTDINGLGRSAVLNTYADVRRAVEHWAAMGIPEARMRKLAIGNYARVLKTALAGAPA
jgi:membrane dipeptidase